MKIKSFKNLAIAGFIAVTLTSCYSTTTCVGTVKKDDPTVKVNSVKNHFLIEGLIGIGNHKVEDSKYVGEHKNYKVKKSLTFLDGLLRVITFGIYTPATTTYYVPLNEVGK